MRSWSMIRGLLVLTILIALAAVACAAEADPPPPPETPATATPVPTNTATATAQPTAVPTAQPTAVPTAAPTPTAELEPYDGELVSMRLPSLGVDAPIEAIGLIPGRNKLDVPGPRTVGWYHIYDKPGFGTSSLYSAHKDYWPDIRGPFYELANIELGDQVVVVMDDGREYVYEVFLHRRYDKSDLPMHDLIWPHKARDADLLRPEGEEWITLITCGGDFVATSEDGAGYYIHRDVVIGRLVATIPPQSVQANQQ